MTKQDGEMFGLQAFSNNNFVALYNIFPFVFNVQ